MGTCFEPRKGQPGKLDKPPHRVLEGQPIIKADKTDPANWSTYDEALSALERGAVHAIGFVFTAEDPFFALDLDNVVNPQTGEMRPRAFEIIHKLDTYTELSVSGKGLHAIGIGAKPDYADCRSRKLGVDTEVYDHSRFLVITGDHTLGTKAEPEGRQRELEDLCTVLFPKAQKMHSGRTERPGEATGVDLEDEKLLGRARSARSGAKFRTLFDSGDVSEFASPSEADFALINMLIFWTAGDPSRICDLFEKSALYREEKKGNYVRRSVEKALKGYSGPFYRPRRIRDMKGEESADPLAPYLELLLDPSLWVGQRATSAYKAYAGMVILASDYGIKDDEDFLRIGCDLRRLAEASGTTIQTLSSSALPTLMKDMKLLKWRRGKGRQASVLTLKKPPATALNNKVTTHYSVQTYRNAKNVLKTLGLLIRMRYGPSGSATLEKLGMPAMFAIVAMLPGVACEYTLEELADRTGRRKSDLKRIYIPRLKAAGIVKEISQERYRLTRDFAERYAWHMDMSGVAEAERRQRRRHEDDRRRRDAKLSTDKRKRDLLGKERVRRIMEERRAEEKARWVEEQRQKVGATVATFIADELEGVGAMHFQAMRRRYIEVGGRAPDLWRAIQYGPWQMYREADGALYVRREDPTEDDTEKRLKRLTSQGMSPRWARAEVLGEGL